MLLETRTRTRKPLRWRPNESGHLDWKLSFCWRRLLSTGSGGLWRVHPLWALCLFLWPFVPLNKRQTGWFASNGVFHDPLHRHLQRAFGFCRGQHNTCSVTHTLTGYARALTSIHLSWLHIQMWPLTDFGQVWVRGCGAGVSAGGDLCQRSHSIHAGVFAQRRSSLRLELVRPQTYGEVSGEYMRQTSYFTHVQRGTRGKSYRTDFTWKSKAVRATSNTCVALGLMWWEAGRQAVA